MTKLEKVAREVLQWLDTGGHTLIPLSVRMSYAEQYATALRAALAEREALLKDARRLQWIEENASCIDLFSDPDNYVRVWYGNGGIATSTGSTLTKAIDAAIAASKGKP